jgi:tRNA(Ile)-lysidine synthase
MPAPKAILSRLAAFNRRETLLKTGDKVLAAVSGGADSVCLAHFLSRERKHKRISATVVHLHHGLRGRAADRDAAFVHDLCADLDLPFVLELLPVRETAKKERRSLEDAGRKLRYAALGSLAKELGCVKIATGHHLDDQVETVFMHLLRGKSARGLGGIPPSRPLKKGSRIRLIRPLLALTRSETEKYCRAYGLKFRTDATNRSEAHTRNWIRRKVLPLLEKRNPGVRTNIAAIADDVRRSLS